MRPPLVDRAGPWFQSLDGTWRFTLVDRPEAAPGGFHRPAFSDRTWAEVAVPGCWTMQGFDRPIYTNYQMPFRGFPPAVPDANPTGCYRTSFTVPDAWSTRRIVLHIGGAESALQIWVNGVEVGISKDSRLEAEFDVTEHVRFGEPNLLAAMVVRWSDASYVEDQDQWWHAGLHREVYLYATDRTYLADVHVDAGLADDLTTGTLAVAATVAFAEVERGDGWTVTARLENAARPHGRFRAARRRSEEPRDVRVRRTRRPARRRGAEGRALVSRDPDPVSLAGRVARSSGWCAGVDDAADRLPAHRDRRARVPRQRPARVVPRRQPSRLRSGDRPRRHRRADARRPGADEAVRIQRGAHVALPQRPALLRLVRRVGHVRRRRSQHRGARVHLQPGPRPPLSRDLGRTRVAHGDDATRTTQAS